jgi:tetratricopeptide (TPR) repeat protein
MRADDALKQETIGDILHQKPDLVDALAAFRTAMALRKALADEASDDRLDRRAQMIDDNRIANALAAQGDVAGALAAFRDGLSIARANAARPDADADSRYDLSISLNGVGWMLTRSKDPAGAAQAFAEALPLVRALVQGEPSRAPYQRELWLVATNLGDAKLAQGDRSGALDAYESGRDAAAALVAVDKADATFANALHTSVDKIGFAANAMLIAGEFQAALAALDHATPAAPDQNWLDLVHAACLMLLDRPDEARALYLKHRGETSFGGKPWETVATAGFEQMRARGIFRPLMDEIEALFAAAK